MELTIYEDQTGLVIYPEKEKKIGKDEKIVTFFNKNIDLFIEKRGDKLTIYCYVLARKGLERDLGYYIEYTDNYSENYFTDFKREADKTLTNLGLEPRHGDTENIISENIEKFNLDKSGYILNRNLDIEVIKNAIKSNFLEYEGASIGEISSFCNEILKNINNIKIAISSKECKLGDINILINKKYEVLLNPNERTIGILDANKKRMINQKKEDEGEKGKNKIREGFESVEEGTGILQNAGYSKKEIDDYKKTFEDEYINEGKSRIKYIIPVAIILIIAGLYFYPLNLQIFSNLIDKNKPIMTETPVVTELSYQTQNLVSEETPIVVKTLSVTPFQNDLDIKNNTSNNTNRTASKDDIVNNNSNNITVNKTNYTDKNSK